MDKMNLLDELAIKYGADKTPSIKHHYTDVYYDLFKDKRNEVKKVLEIGTAEGASLYMWRDFFPNATIYGGEVDKGRVNYLRLKNDSSIEVFQCDQSKGNQLRHLIATIGFGIDLVIDDGSHRESDQFFTCLTLMPWLLKGVTYIIEDVDSDSIGSVDLLKDYDCEITTVGTRHDDRLIIVRHK